MLSHYSYSDRSQLATGWPQTTPKLSHPACFSNSMWILRKCDFSTESSLGVACRGSLTWLQCHGNRGGRKKIIIFAFIRADVVYILSHKLYRSLFLLNTLCWLIITPDKSSLTRRRTTFKKAPALMGSLARTITCINCFPVTINEYGEVIKTCAVNFPKDNIPQSKFKVTH